MRGNLRNMGRPGRAMVEQLEGRMLLSVWAGTWHVQVQEVNAESGAVTAAPQRVTATISDVSPGHFQLNVPAGDFSVDLTGDDTTLGADLLGADPEGGWRDQYVHLKMIDPGVILVAIGTVGYDSPQQNSIEWMNGVGGIATRTTVAITQVPWAGTYAVHSLDVEGNIDQSGAHSQGSSEGGVVKIIATSPRTYTAGSEDDTNPGQFTLSGNKLVQRMDFTDGDGYGQQVGQIIQAPFGRLVHVGMEAEFTSSGQIRSGNMDVSYTDPIVNIAPTLNSKGGSPFLTEMNEDALSSDNPGTLVSDLLGRGESGYIYDPNAADQQGIALTGTDTRRGSWQYSTDGTTWQPVGKVNTASALLLAPDARLRFVPRPDYNGVLTKAITFRAWDQSGTTAVPASVSPSGKMTPFSSATDTASLVVKAVNDAPVIRGFEIPLAYRLGGSAVSIGKGLKLIDVDSKKLQSATITFSGSLLAGEDLIAYHPVTGITGSFDVAANTLTLSGVATVGQYLAALRAITFKVNAAASSAPTRTLTFTVVDELGEPSISVDRLLQITA